MRFQKTRGCIEFHLPRSLTRPRKRSTFHSIQGSKQYFPAFWMRNAK
jgi:hypothetical protein